MTKLGTSPSVVNSPGGSTWEWKHKNFSQTGLKARVRTLNMGLKLIRLRFDFPQRLWIYNANRQDPKAQLPNYFGWALLHFRTEWPHNAKQHFPHWNRPEQIPKPTSQRLTGGNIGEYMFVGFKTSKLSRWSPWTLKNSFLKIVWMQSNMHHS